jgi:hypothetical protein
MDVEIQYFLHLMSMRALKNFGDNHERGNRVKFHCLTRSARKRLSGEFGILLGFTANDPKFFLLAIFAPLFLKKWQNILCANQ